MLLNFAPQVPKAKNWAQANPANCFLVFFYADLIDDNISDDITCVLKILTNLV